MSPVLAGLAVGIGVPILLFYVYGVVPVSLCRNGGCGVTRNGTGVRFDFDDENELMGALGARNGGGTYMRIPRVDQDRFIACVYSCHRSSHPRRGYTTTAGQADRRPIELQLRVRPDLQTRHR